MGHEPDTSGTERTFNAEPERSPLPVVDDAACPRGIQLRSDEQAGEYIRVSCWPGLFLGGLTLLLSLLFAGVAVFMLRQLFVSAFANRVLSAVLALVFSILAAMMSITLVSMIGSVRLHFGPDALLRVRRYPLFTRSAVVPFAYMAGFHFRLSFLTPVRRYYAVYVALDNEMTIKLAGRLRGKRAALWLVRQIETRVLRK